MIHSAQEIEQLVKQFKDRTLPKEKWTHQAHLAVACWYLMNHTVDETICLLKTGIIAYNVTVGGKNTHEEGYHETITIFWIEVIHRFLVKMDGDLYTKTKAFLTSEFADKNILLRCYSKERLFSVKARGSVVTPDLEPIESILQNVSNILK